MKILIAGDYCPRDRVANKIERGDGLSVFSPDLLQKIKEVDYAMVNFECTVADGSDKPIPKCGPNLFCTKEAVKIVKGAGFKGVTLANNHFRDYGDTGVEKTIAALKEQELDYVGGGVNITEATKILYKEFNGEILAIINICENEFSIADEKQGGSAPLDIIDVTYRIREAHEKAQYVLVIIHGGHEHFQFPSPRMKKLYHFFIETGADAVINHHQHCYSGYEEYQGKPIFYGLGNFCFDHPKKRKGIWNEGYMVALQMTNGTIKYELLPYTQCDEEPVVESMIGLKLQKFQQTIKDINHIISDDGLLKQKFDDFETQVGEMVITPYTPYFNEYVRAAAGRHYIPYLIPRKKMAAMLNFIICESHRDVLIKSMQKKLEK